MNHSSISRVIGFRHTTSTRIKECIARITKNKAIKLRPTNPSKLIWRLLLSGGHLDRFIDQAKTLEGAQNTGAGPIGEKKPIIMHVIYGPVTKTMESRFHKESDQVTSATVGKAPKQKLPTKESQWTIKFTEKDLEGL